MFSTLESLFTAEHGAQPNRALHSSAVFITEFVNSTCPVSRSITQAISLLLLNISINDHQLSAFQVSLSALKRDNTPLLTFTGIMSSA